MRLDKNTTTIMKGYGILFIALHNLLHVQRFTGFVPENENSFNLQHTLDYINTFRTFEWSDLGQFFSFLGWIGVPVFLFLSGYGLAKKYEKDIDISFRNYYIYSWKKLALLLLPAALFYVALSFVDSKWQSVIPEKLLQMTLLNNFFIPIIKVNPGVYWYFGLTFELYLLFYVVRRLNVKQLLVIWGGVVVIQAFTRYFIQKGIIFETLEMEGIWSWLRHNLFGWGHVFLTGMIVAKTDIEKWIPNNAILLLILSILSIVILPMLLLSMWSWLILVPFIALFFFVFLAGAVNKTIVLRKVGIWLGRYSAFIFVCHPIIRTVLGHIQDKVNMPLLVFTMLYMLGFLLLAIVYKPVFQWLMENLLIRKTKVVQ